MNEPKIIKSWSDFDGAASGIYSLSYRSLLREPVVRLHVKDKKTHRDISFAEFEPIDSCLTEIIFILNALGFNFKESEV